MPRMGLFHVALDSDGDARNESFIAGSLGIWKWREL